MKATTPPASSVGVRIADAVTLYAGSIRAVLLHLVWWAIWLPTGLFGLDRAPYPLLTNVLSLEAILLTLLVLISQNRSADRDREMLRRQSDEVDDIDTIEREDIHLIRDMHAMLTAIRVSEPSVVHEAVNDEP